MPDLAPRRGTLGAVARLAGRHPAEGDRPAATASTAVKPELVQEVWGRTQAEIYPGMGQDLMLDQGWPQVADRVDTWGRPLPTPIVPASHHPHPGRRPTP